MSKKIIVFHLAAVVVISILAFVSIQNMNEHSTTNEIMTTEQEMTKKQIQNNTEYDTLIPPGEPIKQRQYTAVLKDLSEIKSLNGFDVRLEKSLPDEYQVQYIGATVSPYVNYVNIWVSKQPITDKTTDMGFVYGGEGISVTIAKLNPKVHTPENLYNKIALFDPVPINVNGHEGFGNDIYIRDWDGDGIPSRSPAQLNFVNEDKYIVIIGMVPLETLIGIAESL